MIAVRKGHTSNLLEFLIFGAALYDTIHDWDSQLQLTLAIEHHSGKKLLLTLWLWIYVFIF